MDFTLNPDFLALRESVSRFLMIEAAPEKLREIWQTDAGRSPEMRSMLAAQGLTALSVPEELGGMGMDDMAWSLITQELGYFAIPDSLVDSAYIAVGLLNRLPLDSAIRATWLQKIAEGTGRVAVGHPINPWVADAHMADLLLLAHPTPGGTAWHAVLPSDVQIKHQRSTDASRRLAQVGWEPSNATLLLDGATGQAVSDEVLDRAALATAGQLIGLAQRMLDLSVDYVAQRKQFGKPIGSFQAVKHHLADVITQLEFAKPVLYRAAYAVAHGDPERGLRVSHAKLAACDASWLAARKGIQVHGAMGYTWEVDLQMFMKRAWALDAAWGSRAFHKVRLSDALFVPLPDGVPDGAPLLYSAPTGPGSSFSSTNQPKPNPRK